MTVASQQPGVPASMIVKLPTADPGGQFVGQLMRVWEREHRFYRDLAPLMTIRVPTAYANVAEPACLLLEDLAPAMPGDHVAGASPDQAYRAIDLLAAHHAHWFEHPPPPDARLDARPRRPRHPHDAGHLRDGMALFQERFAGRVPSRCLAWCERFVAAIPEWIKGHYDDRITLVHGDFRLDNLFFLDDGGVAVIDWQLAMRARGRPTSSTSARTTSTSRPAVASKAS